LSPGPIDVAEKEEALRDALAEVRTLIVARGGPTFTGGPDRFIEIAKTYRPHYPS
jgi:hypothetical protein